ncbi:MAG TPA: T9SS type A sorting domain-containing protein, partial [Chitinophagales bacterium]|nr:T9SS type A sorting domain-containing protein [Chitinophagales bacterium]
TGTTPALRCDAGTVDLGATASAGTINWYAASSGGPSLGSGTTFTTPSIAVTTPYYVDATNNGCTTASRTAVTATVAGKPVATIGYQSCAGVNGSTTIRVTPAGGTGPFLYSIDNVTFTSTDTVHVANGSSNNYYVKDNNNCVSDPTNYAATAPVPTQIPSALGSTSCSCPSSNEGRDVYLTDGLGNLIAVINDKGHDLGTITATVYTKASPVIISNNQGGNTAALGRNFVLDFNGTNLTPAVEVKFPFTDDELTDLTAAAAATPDGADDINSLTDLGSTQYEGPDEDSTYNSAAATMLVYHRQLSHGSILNGKFVKIGLSANGEHWLHGGGNGSPLPVTLVSFEATAKPVLQQVQTKWVTSMEINNDYFTVERSSDGVNFAEVGQVEGAGNSTTNINYVFNDTKPLTGVSYYRLKQTDFDGHFTYSNVVAVAMGEQTAVRMYPNPAEDDLFVAVANPGTEIAISIHDVSGRTLFAQSFEGNRSTTEQVLKLQVKQLLSAGIYMVNVASNGTEYKQKLILD